MKFSSILPLLVLALQISCASPPARQDKPEFVLYPGLHKLFLEPAWSFTLSDLLGSLEAGHVDAICVEIPADDYQKSSEGLYPPEAAAVSEVFGKMITVIPADWRAPHREYRSPSTATINLVADLKAIFDVNLSHAPNKIRFAFSSDGEAQIKKMHDTIIDRDGQEADGFWKTRNEKISENCLNASFGGHFHRVGLVFGIDHLYIIRERLAGKGYRVSDGVLVSSAQDLISPAVVQRWQRNLSALKKIRGSSHPKADAIDDSGRLQELEAFIQHSTK